MPRDRMPPAASDSVPGVDIAARCKVSTPGARPEPLREVVTDLYEAGVDPGVGTEALLRANCDTLAAIVSEMVVQGGPGVVDAVSDRALLIAGAELQPVVAAGILLGLERLGQAGQQPPSRTYGLAYFATRADGAPLVTAPHPSPLYYEAIPGYGLYTFVLFGVDRPDRTETDRVRQSELMRLLRRYVLAPDSGRHDPIGAAHAFLVAVEPQAPKRSGNSAADGATSAELAAAMRAAFLAHLRHQGQTAVAKRLEGRAGPFFVSGREPRLVPTGGDGPRLLVDLTDIGVEYLYNVIDAYDRPIGASAADGAELEAIRGRLRGLLGPGRHHGSATVPEDWIVLVPPAPAAAAARVESSSPAAKFGGASQPMRCRDASLFEPKRLSCFVSASRA